MTTERRTLRPPHCQRGCDWSEQRRTSSGSVADTHGRRSDSKEPSISESREGGYNGPDRDKNKGPGPHGPRDRDKASGPEQRLAKKALFAGIAVVQLRTAHPV